MRIASLSDEHYALHTETEETVVKPLAEADKTIDYAFANLDDLNGVILSADRDRILALMDEITYKLTRVRESLARLTDVDAEAAA